MLSDGSLNWEAPGFSRGEHVTEAHNKFSERECLKCGVVFLSECPWNRKCLSCKSAEADSAYQYADRTYKVKTGKYQYFE